MLTLLIGFFAFLSATNQVAIDYYLSGDAQTAKKMLLQTTNKDAIDDYYLGLIYIQENNPNEARASFEKGLQIDSENVYNQIGIATLEMTTDKKSTDKKLKRIYKKNKKNVDVVSAIAEAYLLNRDTEKASDYLSRARKANKKSAVPYILEGIYLEKDQKRNDAAAKYENALYFDPNSKIALAKLAQLYVGTRMTIAFEYLNKAVEIDPNYEYALKTQSRLYYKNGFYEKAKQAQEKYMSLIAPTSDDYQTYAELLYFSKLYQEALVALEKSPQNTVTDRLNMYCYYELGNYPEALKYSEKLFENTAKKDLIAQDYSYSANIYTKEKKYDNAAKVYEAAYTADTTKTELLTDAAKSYNRARDYNKSAEIYGRLLSVKDKKDVSMADYYSLGEAYRLAGVDTIATPVKEDRENNLRKSDETYAKMIELFPEHYLGYLMRARVNSFMDPQTTEGLAKPYYEKLLEVVEPKADDHKKEIKEVYQYLGVYFLKTDKYDESKIYWEKVLEIDPENATAKQVLESLNAQ